MASRLKLHEELCAILESRSVYFQPPESIKMKYPCIVYSKTGMDQRNANDRLYKGTNRYEVTYIDQNPDSEVPDKILAHFQMCKFDRTFKSENLNHNVLTLYY